MIDIHCHILPGIDDGAADLQESLAMAKQAVEEGIHTIIATPHHANGFYDNDSKAVLASVELLNAALLEAQIPLTIAAGQEIRKYHNLLDDFQAGRLLPLGNSKYMLIELPSSNVPKDTDHLIYELTLLGITPVIAHPERNRELAQEPSKLAHLIELGALSQITSHSINGLFGKKIQETALDMCKWNLVHFVASDAHNLSHRAFGLREAYRLLDKQLDSSFTSYYMENSEQLLNNQNIIPKSIQIYIKKRFKFWK